MIQIILLLIGCGLTYILCCICETRQLRFWRSDTITPMSVKESIDTLPSGLCYYWPDGLVKLSNEKMLSLCAAITGDHLSDGASFWNMLSCGDVPGAVQGGEQPIVRLPDGVFSFKRHVITMEGAELYELTAADVTMEYSLSLELMEKEQMESYVNRRLKAYSETMKYVTMEQEALRMKIRIHDEWGQGLLAAKRYLLSPGTVDGKALIKSWRGNIRLLRREGDAPPEAPFLISLRYAEALGITVETDGELPEALHLRDILDTAISVHVTNVFRHAQGTTAYLSVQEMQDVYRLTFTNDGQPPERTIQETGGLANLRREVVSAGGRMVIQSAPAFQMILTLPKEERGHGI